ncbi:MAG TPA: serine hydrolase domain-containing protein, partial [Longimicrobium sp.]|nr:serine hydrolase domain-containing protein [Longimicrobium sp.]
MKIHRASLPLALAASALAHPAAMSQSPAAAPPPLGAITRLDGRVLSPEQVTATVERLMREGAVPGVALAILNRGEIVYQRGFGQRDVERRLPLGDTTVMYAASFTKAMFAYMVMGLVQEGRMDLDRPIERDLPRPLPAYEKYAELAGDERWRRITPRMLLSHTAGFANFRFVYPDGKLRIEF